MSALASSIAFVITINDKLCCIYVSRIYLIDIDVQAYVHSCTNTIGAKLFGTTLTLNNTQLPL